MKLVFKSQPREELTPKKTYRVEGQQVEERLFSHRGEYVAMTPPAGFPPKSYEAPSEAVYEWVLQDERGRQWRYELPESEPMLLGKSVDEVHERMKVRFTEQLRNEVLAVST